MELFKRLKPKIKEENISLLDSSERDSEFYLKKLLAWQDEYNCIEWEEFKNNWTYCELCKGYSEGSCICYAR